MLRIYLRELVTRGLRDYDRSSNVTGILSACWPIFGAAIMGYVVGLIWGSEIAANEFLKALGVTKENIHLVAAGTGLVVTFLVRAPYGAWLFQRERADKLENKLKPKFEVDFQPDSDGLCATKWTGPGFPVGGAPTIFIRGHVKSTTAARLDDCRATISRISVYRNNQWEKITAAGLPVWWASGLHDTVRATVAPGETAFFNIAWIAQGMPLLHPASKVTPVGVAVSLGENSLYRFQVAVDALDASVRHLEVEIDWRSNLSVSVKKVYE